MGQALQNFVSTVTIYGIPHQIALQADSIASATQRSAEFVAADVAKLSGTTTTPDATIEGIKNPGKPPAAVGPVVLDPVVHGH